MSWMRGKSIDSVYHMVCWYRWHVTPCPI